jgi:AcrR family transcriptional regulator
MPRHIDPDLETRILKAARKLWSKGGEKALSMRAIASIADTNTPAVYRRFRNRDEILRALVESYQGELQRSVSMCNSLEDVGDAVLKFALDHPREYELMMSGLLAKMTKSRPNFEFVVRKSAEWLGGSPEDHRGLVLALWSLIHGTIMLAISGTLPEAEVARALASFRKCVTVLVENRAQIAKRRAQTSA